jgi:hypothetical protein
MTSEVHTVPLYSLDGAIRQRQVPDMWHKLWDDIFTHPRHVHLSFVVKGEKFVHCWNCGMKSVCRTKPNRTICTGLDPASEEYQRGPGRVISDWIPIPADQLREMVDGV